MRLLLECSSTHLITRVLDNMDATDINAPFDMGDTLLILVSSINKPAITAYLLERGDVYVGHRNASGYKDNALSWAVFNGHFENVKLLVAYGADVQTVTQVYGRSLLSWAYRNGHATIFQYLLMMGCNIAHRDFSGLSIEMEVAHYPYNGYIRAHQRLVAVVVTRWLDSYGRNYEHGLIDSILEYYC
jgi:ankyrin repeat protein